jgi:hypothetical protein
MIYGLVVVFEESQSTVKLLCTFLLAKATILNDSAIIGSRLTRAGREKLVVCSIEGAMIQLTMIARPLG